MAIQFVDYDTVLKSRNRHASWTRVHDRLKPEAWPHFEPTFRLNPGALIFTMGSCFARNIEDQLALLGYQVPTRDFKVPKEEAPHRANGILNKYTPQSIEQEIKWTADLYRRDAVPEWADCEKYAYRLDDGTILDNNLSGGASVSQERFLQRRRDLYTLNRAAFTAECVVITPGLVEAWYDKEREIYIQNAFTHRIPSITKNHMLAVLDFAACFKCLDETVATIREFNPGCKFLLTTSPVPMQRTFTRHDVILANSYSKCTLRSVCGELADKWEGLDYFPSFESVTLTRSWDIFAEDLIHVTDAFVAKIIGRLSHTYCAPAAQAARAAYAAE